MVVCFGIHTQHINALCGQNVQFLILLRQSRCVSGRFGNEYFNIPPNTTTCLLLKNSYMFRS